MPEFIAHYRVGPKLGQGAMGEVYRATDTKLGRDVAIKLIAPTLTADETRLASFTREAQVLASLNHPNIAAIYGVEDHALVMELVEGPTLADRIKQGPMPLEEALPIARQIAEGLAAAHDRGIVHRDLKPANIKVTSGGVVKLLDFGLAKAAAVAATSQDDAATVAFSMVGADQIVGTPAYMAPEQARGLPLDRRADIWAFGVVFYEMLTGTTLFKGETLTDIMAAVIREEPDLTRVPAAVRPVLRRCLEKDPKRRLRDVGDAILLLETTGETAVVETRASGGWRWLPWTAAAAAAVAFAALLAVHLRETPPSANTIRFKMTLPAELTFTQTTPFALSPDGRVLAFPAVSPDGVTRIWLQPFDQTSPRALTSAEVRANPDVLFWSPDSRSIVFSHDQKLKRVDVEGNSPPITLGDLPRQMIGFAMNRDGVMVYGTGEGIARLDVAGGTPTMLTMTAPERLQAPMQFLPDGRRFLYTTGGAAGKRAIHIGSIDRKAAEQPTEPILMSDFGAAFVPAAGSLGMPQLLTVRDSTLEAQDFDPDAGSVRSEPRAIADNIFVVNTNAFGLPFYSASDEGSLVYRTGTTAEGLSRQLAWIGRDGRTQTIFSELGRYNQVKVSPDGTRVVTSRSQFEGGPNAADLWITDLASETSSKFTFGNGINAQPVWSHDGTYIAWARVGKGTTLMRKRSDGSAPEEVLYEYPEGAQINVSDWSHDGRYLIYSFASDVFALPIGPGTERSRTPIPIAAAKDVREFGASVSPNGRWITYVSNETSRQELYVQTFAPAAAATGSPVAVGGKWLVSRTGTMGLARWRSDSRELIFLNADGALTSVAVAAEPAFKAGPPQVLAPLPRSFLVQAGNPGALADATRDLERLLLAIPSEASRRQELSVVLNWPGALVRR
jgi:serine/threonine protein kinase